MASVRIIRGPSFNGNVQYRLTPSGSWVDMPTSFDVTLAIAPAKTYIYLRAIPNTGYNFSSWSGASGRTVKRKDDTEYHSWDMAFSPKGLDSDTTLELRENRDVVINPLFIEDGRGSMLTLTYTLDSQDLTTDIPVTEVIDFGDVQKIERRFDTSVTRIGIIKNTMRRAFAMDLGVTQTIDANFKRVSPLVPDDNSQDSTKWTNVLWWVKVKGAIDRWQSDSDGFRMQYTPAPEYRELSLNHDYNVYLNGMTYNYRETDSIRESISFKVGKMNLAYSQPPRVIVRYNSITTKATRHKEMAYPLNVNVPLQSLPIAWANDGTPAVFLGWVVVIGLYDTYASIPTIGVAVDRRAVLTQQDGSNQMGIYKFNGTTWALESPSSITPLSSGSSLYLTEPSLFNGELNLYAIWATPSSTWVRSVAGTYSVPIPSGALRAHIYIQGGGGGGGYYASLNQFSTRAGGGGGGGQHIYVPNILVASLANLNVTVGGGGGGGNRSTRAGGFGAKTQIQSSSLLVEAVGGGGGTNEGTGGYGGGGTGSPPGIVTGVATPGQAGGIGGINNLTAINSGGRGGVGTSNANPSLVSSPGNGGGGTGCGVLWGGPCQGGIGYNGAGGGGGGSGFAQTGADGGNGGSGYVVIHWFG